MNFLITVNTSVLSGGGHTEDVIAVCLNTGNTAGILTPDHIFQFLWWYRMYLSVYPYICLGKETTTYHFYNQLFLKYGVEIIPDTEAATTDQVLPLVKSELGLAFLPEEMTEEALAKHEIIQIRLKEEIPERYVCMVYDRKRPMSVAAQKLKQILDKGESYAEIK